MSNNNSEREQMEVEFCDFFSGMESITEDADYYPSKWEEYIMRKAF